MKTDKAIQLLGEQLQEGEEILAAMKGNYVNYLFRLVPYGNERGVLVATNERVVFVNKKNLRSFPYSQISGIESAQAPDGSRVRILGQDVVLLSVRGIKDKDNYKEFVSVVSVALRG